MIVVLLVFWAMCGGLAAFIASSKGGDGMLGFVAGVLLGPIGVIVAMFMGSEKGVAMKAVTAGEKKKCPDCAELVQPEARVCRFCRHEFPATSGQDASEPGGPISEGGAVRFVP
jgi:hypothetical protein